MNDDPDCRECREVEGLDRVLAARDVLDSVAWATCDPQRGIAAAMVALRNAIDCFSAAGFSGDQ